jgi:hypothetical protein
MKLKFEKKYIIVNSESKAEYAATDDFTVAQKLLHKMQKMRPDLILELKQTQLH